MMIIIFIGALLTLGFLPTSSIQNCIDTEPFIGTIEIFEHSFFRSDDGRILAVRIEGRDAQSQIASRIRTHDKSEVLCLRVDFEGRLTDEKDFTDRQIVSILSFRDLRVTECEPHS